MLRILWILSLALLIGAYEHDSWKSFFETLSREMNQSLQKSLSVFPEVSFENSHSESSSTNPCESVSNCHQDSLTTSTDSPVVGTSKPGTLDDYSIHEDSQQKQVGSMKGKPGENFPDYTDIPATSFDCSNQDYVPGFYADLESRCQVFHACWPHRRESFLCPVGTTFNQALLACDYWYSSNCSLAPHYYNVNGYSIKSTDETKDTPDDSMIDVLLGTGQEQSKEELHKVVTSDSDTIAFISQFLPVKAKVTIYPETSGSKPRIVATASVGKRKKRHHSTTESQDFTKEPQTTSEAVIKETQYSTESHDCQATIKYINVEAAVKLAFNSLENIVKNIIREIKEYMAANAAKKICSTVHTDGISVLTKIKQKLIPRPLVTPVLKMQEPVIASKTDAAVDPTATKSSTADIHRKPVDSRTKHTRLSISPLTKKTLIESYIKLLKLRKS